MTEAKAMIASVSVIPVRVIKNLPADYLIPDPLPWAQLAGPLAAAEDALARLDERLAKSPIRDGWIARTHFVDAVARDDRHRMTSSESRLRQRYHRPALRPPLLPDTMRP